ncbi:MULTISPECIES: MaoC family dehydratase [Rhodococcus]|uniref:MaoC family dehydratase n=1 Tax=Rhodococcus TaxID=1827 RepID=UPI00146BFAD1|nr:MULTISPECIES: MaoC family dehydratase [Rhodococcus]MDI9935286.1 MaoC family dehydratase [Rhodococcus sp. IEGM 1351]MDJ0414320.1 MaoC family dehydratase [Rhodococcus opacus]WKN57534.1 MaoC family dehydratase [Rhodococcus opacus]
MTSVQEESLPADSAEAVDLLEGRYYEEVSTGQRFIAPAVTITESMITTACGLFQDLALLHRDHRIAAENGFRGPIAPGALTMGACIAPLALVIGKKTATHLTDEITYKAPVYAGDTLDIEIVAVHREEKSRFGLIEYATHVTNQDGQKVAEILTKMGHAYAPKGQV